MQPQPLLCPRCRVPSLCFGRAGTLDLFACARCGGVWLDEAWAGALLRPIEAELTPTRDHFGVVLGCPGCLSSMSTWHSPSAQVVIDRCQGHGVWFDRDELEHIRAAVARQRPAWGSVPHGTAVAGIAMAGAAGAVAMATYGAPTPAGNGPAEGVVQALVRDPATAVDGALAASDIGGALADIAAEPVAEAAGATVEVVVAVAENATGAVEAAGGLLAGIFGFLDSL